jgi:asparagine synthase (glutamine-hydrolysing)
MLGDVGAVQRMHLLRGLRSIGHRGPDSSGTWVSDDARVGLAHARLAITGIESGTQPIGDESGEVHAVVNGEFYEFERLRVELERAGHVFRTDSDSEVLVHLYQELGSDCLSQLRGEFAFVLWDAKAKRLFAARDRFGMKPLFYARRNGVLFLASEAKALFASGITAAWDHEAFLQHLFMLHAEDETLFRGVSQLPAGKFLEAQSGTFRVQSYWDLDFPRMSGKGSVHAADEPTHIEGYRIQLMEAVRLRLRSDVPIGCFLSGGIDSSAVLALAASSGKQIKAFTVRFDHETYDEGDVAELVARHVGADYHPIRLTQNDLADAFSDAVFHAETVGSMHGVARFLQSRTARDAGCKVALTGDGADETLAGYSHFRLDVSNTGSVKAPALLAGFRDRMGFVPAWVARLASERAPFHALLSEHAASLANSAPFYDRFLEPLDLNRACVGRHPLAKSLYLWCKTILPNYSLCADRLEMAFSVEGRHPFLDHRLFEYVRTLPAELLLRDGQEKYILREAAKPFVPDAVYRRRKHPFTAPPATSDLGGKVMQLIQDQLRGEAMKSMPFFDRNSVIALLDALPNMPAGRRLTVEPLLMILLCSCFLQERYRLQ